MTLDETVESYIGLVDMFFKQFLIYPYVKDSDSAVYNLAEYEEKVPLSVVAQRLAIKKQAKDSGDYIKEHFILIGDYISGIITRGGVKAEVKYNINHSPNFDSKFREYCLVQMQKYHKSRDEVMYTVSKLDEFTPFSYEVVGDKHILKNLKTGGIIEPVKS